MKKKKSLLLCLCLALAFSGTVATMASCDDDDKKPSSNKPMDYEESGTYYVTVGESEYTVVLNDGEFELKIGETTLSGDYKYDGETLTLKQGKKVIIDATLVNGVLKLTFEGTDYTFLAKVEYTVSFNVDGTVDEAKKQTVLNGKKATKPDAPKKDGYTFVGWYADSSYTVPYTFDETVSQNVVLYARFIKADATKKEFTITYEVDGAVLSTAQTVDGAIYNLPTPVKEGSTFLGWWSSDFEDASKLTAQIQDGAKVAQNVTLYAVWKSDAPAVSVTASGATWTDMGVGAQYTVVLTGPNGQPQIIPVATNRYDYDFTKQAAGTYSLAVSVNGKTTTVFYNNKGLAQVTHFETKDNVVIFEKVANATNYLITVKCGDTTHNHVDVDLGDVNAFDFSNCAMPKDGIKFVVKATAAGYGMSVSEEYVVVRNLAKVENLSVDAATEEVSWKAVENAKSYALTIKCGDDTETLTVEGTSYSLKNYGVGKYTLSVVPVAFGYVSADATTMEYNKVRLVAPANLQVNGQTLEWDQVEGAKSYQVKIGDKTYDNVNACSFTLTEDNIPDGVSSVEISVIAVGATAAENSFASTTTVSFSTMADNLVYANGEVKWSPVLNATKYEVQLNDGEWTEVANTASSAAITFTASGLNTIKVRCYDGANKVSDPVSVDVEVYKIDLLGNGGVDAATLYKAAGDTIDLSKVETERRGYQFAGWYDEAENGTPVADTYTVGKGDTAIYAGWTANKYNIAIYLKFGDETAYKKVEVTYDQHYKLPVVEDPDGTNLSFMGWFTEANGAGFRYADDTGASTSVYKTEGDTNVYGCWGEMLKYEKVMNLEGEYTYRVVAGKDIDKVTEVTVPAIYDGKAVTEVGGGAFDRCSNLVKINLPDSIQYIEFGEGGYSGTGNAFGYCKELDGVYIYYTPGSHKRLYESDDASGSLMYTDPLTKEKMLVYVPQKTTKYVVPEGVEVITANVFKSTEVTDVTVPASVKRVERDAFWYCDTLEKLTFLEAEEGQEASLEISDSPDTFYLCKSLTDLTLPSHLSLDTDFSIFDNSYKQLKEFKVNATADKGGFYAVNGLLCYGKGADATIVYAPSGYETENKTLTIPENIYKIGPKAFYKSSFPFTTFETVNIGGQVTEIGKSAFEGIEVLKTINFQANEQTTTTIDIASKAFYACVSMTSVKLPMNMGKLSANAFGGITGLVAVELNANSGAAMKLEANAFASTGGTFSVSQLTIGKYTPAFEVAAVFGGKLTTLDVVKENNFLKTENDVLFDKKGETILYVGATKAGEYTIDPGVKEIKASVFANRNISKLTIPASVTTIGDNAFNGCAYLEEIIFLEAEKEEDKVALTVGKNAFKGATLLSKLTVGTQTSIALPNRTTSIGAYAFDSTALDGALVLPTDLTSLGAGAYANTGITSVKIPAALTQLPMGTAKGYVSAQFSNGGENLTMSVFDLFDGCEELVNVEVDAKNPNYVAVGGVLYAIKEDKATLLYAPSALTVASDKAEEVNVLNIPASVTVGEKAYPLSEVASYAFHNMQNIKKIVFADSTAEITFNSRAFAYDSFKSVGSLTEIKLPAGAKSISKQMFYNCTALEKVNVPYTVSLIDSAAFFNNYALSDLAFDPTPTGKTEVALELGDAGEVKTSGSTAGEPSSKDYLMSTFFGCKSLTSLNLPDRTSRIGMGVFYTGLSAWQQTAITSGNDWKFGFTSVVIPANVTEIAPYAFAASSYQKGTITSVTFGEGESKLKKIGSYAFYRSGLTSSFTMPSSVTTLGKYAFQYSDALETVVCSSQVEELPQNIFDSCTSLSEFSFTAGESKIKTISTGVFKATAITSFTVPASVETIKANVFTSCFDLTTVNFATYAEGENAGKSSLKELQNQVFNYCPKLTNLVFPETVEELTFTTASPTFVACQNLKTVTLPSTVQSIENVFTECSALENIIISPNNQNLELSGAMVMNKGGKAIRYCYGQIEGDAEGTYTIANGVEEIGYGAFMGMPNIKKLVIPNSVKTIGTSAFAAMPDLEEVVFVAGNDNLTVFPYGAFQYCTKLKKVTLPDHLVSMAGANNKSTSYAFYGCTSLKEIELPDTLQYMGGYMFGASGLQKITVPEKVEFTATGTGSSVHGASLFRNCPELQEIELLGKATHLPQYFAAYCPKLKTLKGFDGVTYLAGSVFRESGIEEIDLSNVTFIYTYAFDGCVDLKKVTFGDKLTQMGGSATSHTNSSYVFRNCTALEEVKLPSSLSVLCSYNFRGCTSLKKVDLGGVKKIGNATFLDCTQLSEVKGLESVTTLGSQTFQATALTSADLSSATSLNGSLFRDCKQLSEVKFNSTLTTIPYGSFYGCSALTSINLPDSLTSLGSEMFWESGITSIKIPSGVTAIEYCTFYNCKDLESVECLGKVTSIGNDAFYGCEKLTSVKIGNVLETIDFNAFAGCVALEEIDLPNTLSYIGEDAFRGSGLSKVHLSSNLSELGGGAFLDCANLTAENVTVAAGGVFSKAEDGRIYDLAGRLVWAPADLVFEGGLLTVTKDMKFAGSPFSGNTTITKIVVEEGVTEIPDSLFRAIPNVTDIQLPEGITTIGAYAFADCAKLVNVNIPSTVKSIGKWAFYKTTSAINVDTTNATSLETLGDYMFRESGVVSFTLPAKVTTLPNQIFYKATSLTTLNVLGELKTILPYALAFTKVQTLDVSKVEVVDYNGLNFTDIKELHFGVNLEKICDTAVGYWRSAVDTDEQWAEYMAEQSKVEVVTFADNGKLTQIGSNTQGAVFGYCLNLRKVKLPNTLQGFSGYYTFYGCTNLSELIIPEGVETLGAYTAGSMYQSNSYGDSFTGCTSLTKVTLPSTIKYITANAFKNCTNLEEINLPEKLLVIGDGAFAGCTKLSKISLPANLYVLGANAFEGCTAIESLTVAKNVYVKDSAFAGWTAEQTVNFIGDKYSVTVLDATAIDNSNAKFVYNYTVSEGV